MRTSSQELRIANLLFNMPLSKLAGSSRFTTQISSQLAKQGHLVVVIANKEPTPSKKVYNFHLIEVDTPPYGSWVNCLHDEKSFIKTITAYLLALVEAHRNYKFNILHVQHLLFSTLIATLFKNLYNVPFVATCHGTETYESKDIPRMRKFFSYAKNADCITSASESILLDMQELTGVSKKNVRITNPGVDIQTFRPSSGRRSKVRKSLSINENQFVILFAGRLVAEKGILKTPYIFKEFLRTHPSSILLLVGDGQERNGLEYILFKELMVPKNAVRFVGTVAQDDMPGYYNAADVLLMPTVWNEPFATTILESMASGCAVLTSNIGGIPPILRKNGLGFFVCSNEHGEDSFVQKLDTLCVNKRLYKSLIAKAIGVIRQHYTWEVCTNRMLKVYGEVIKNVRDN